MIKLGIDVGGTHTDAVLVDGHCEVRAKAKVPTTQPVDNGIANAINAVIARSDLSAETIQMAMLGTTQCTNAVVERRGLARVGVVRIGAPTAQGVPPLSDWPDDVKQCLNASVVEVSGGSEYDGRVFDPLDKKALRAACQRFRGQVEAIAITSVFAPVKPDHELEAAALVTEELGEIPTSMSHQIGSFGLLERENATIMNAALCTVARALVGGFRRALRQAGVIRASHYFGQNDGTLMSGDQALRYPVLTVACGPTNSLRGARFLSGLEDAIVADVGGTTTDIGVLARGFPRQSALAVEIGGIRTNFPMPDILSVALGGGTTVNTSDGIRLGPQSVGRLLTELALVFGGQTLTATDVACAKGVCDIGVRPQLDPTIVARAYECMQRLLEESIDRMKTRQGEVPVVLVGGGSILFSDSLAGASRVVRPPHAEVANAIGVAMGEVGGSVDHIYDLSTVDRHAALNDARRRAIAQAVAAGACPQSLSIVHVDEVPLAYLPGNALRIRVKAAGRLDLAQSSTTF